MRYRFAWKRQTVYDERDILQQLPTFLRTKVALYLNADLIKAVPFLRDLGKDCLALFVTELKPLQIAPNTMLFKRGALGREMYFVVEGAVEVLGRKDKVICTLEKGAYFGEYAILSNKPTKRSMTVRYSNLLAIHQHRFIIHRVCNTIIIIDRWNSLNYFH
jgi:CRP-like cAMP-binding protein